MLNKMSVLIGAAAVAIGAGAGFADPFDTNRTVADTPPICASDSTCDQNRSAFGNGYNYGYSDGYRRKPNNNNSGTYDDGSRDHGPKGAYYYIGAAPVSGAPVHTAPRGGHPLNIVFRVPK
jgi:hypothetical protein